MAKCPYTWVRGLFGANTPAAPGEPARHLMVRVVRDGDEKVLVSLPARGARVLLDLIPVDVIEKIRAEEIPLDAMVEELRQEAVLMPRPIFALKDASRSVDVWLE